MASPSWRFGARRDGCAAATGAAAAAARSRHPFVVPGVAVDVTLRSTELSFVSWPSGFRTMLDPGEAVAGGAAAATPSTSAFVAVPQPTPSTRAPVESRTATPPPVAAIAKANDWFATCAPAYALPPRR